MLPGFRGGDGVLDVPRMRRGNVDGVDVGVLEQRGVIAMRRLGAGLFRKLSGRFGAAAGDGLQRGGLARAKRIGETAGDGAGGRNAESKRVVGQGGSS
jgi:hypothetical protein